MCASGSSYVVASWPLRGIPLGSRCPPRVGVLHGKKFCTFRLSLQMKREMEMAKLIQNSLEKGGLIYAATVDAATLVVVQ